MGKVTSLQDRGTVESGIKRYHGCVELENVEPWLDTVSENLDLDHFEDVQWEDKRPYFEPELVRVRSDADGDSNWDGSRDPSDRAWLPASAGL